MNLTSNAPLEMSLCVVGSSSAIPTKERNLPSFLLKTNLGDMLFDCGDGTQLALKRFGHKISTINKIFITHLHGDHFYGLPGLLASHSFNDNVSPLTIYGPEELNYLLEAYYKYEGQSSSITFNKIEEGVIIDAPTYQVRSAKLLHRTTCFGLSVIEKDRLGKLLVDKLTSLDIPPGKIYGQLKLGKDVTMENGTVLKSDDFLGPPIKGKHFAYITDTSPVDTIDELILDADLLVIESTYAQDKVESAKKYHHLTSKQSIEIATRCRVKKVILTHFSARYTDPNILLENLEIPDFMDVQCAHDGMQINF